MRQTYSPDQKTRLQIERTLWKQSARRLLDEEYDDEYNRYKEFYDLGVETGVSKYLLPSPPSREDYQRIARALVLDHLARIAQYLGAIILDPVDTHDWLPDDFGDAEVAPLDGGHRVRISFRKKTYIFEVTPR